jgi:hypothetical protein
MSSLFANRPLQAFRPHKSASPPERRAAPAYTRQGHWFDPSTATNIITLCEEIALPHFARVGSQ